MDAFVAGVDIGGTGTKFGIVDNVGNVLFASEISTKKHEQVHTFIDELHQELSVLIEKVGGVGRIKGIGVGAPNGNVYTGNIEYAPNLPWKGIIPLARMLQDKFKIPVRLTNDANAAAVGEMMYGAAQGMKDFIMITLGTGVGSGIVANGQLVYGHDGFAGELGHTTIFLMADYILVLGKKAPWKVMPQQLVLRNPLLKFLKIQIVQAYCVIYQRAN